jgi:hypothetical protein
MPDRSKGRGQTKCSRCASNLGLVRGVNDLTLKTKLLLRSHGEGQEPHRVLAPQRRRRRIFKCPKQVCSFGKLGW